MLVTIFEKTSGGWRAIRRYYRFDIDGVETQQLPNRHLGNNRKTRYVCPGCDTGFTEQAFISHRCIGGAAAYPRLAERIRVGRPKKLSLD